MVLKAMNKLIRSLYLDFLCSNLILAELDEKIMFITKKHAFKLNPFLNQKDFINKYYIRNKK